MKNLIVTAALSSWLILICCAKNDKEDALASVMLKVCNISKTVLTGSAPQQRPALLDGLEQKFHSAFNALGPESEKYVELMMQGVRIMAVNNDFRFCEAQAIRSGYTTNQPSTQSNTLKTQPDGTGPVMTQAELALALAYKIDLLVKKSLRNATTFEQKKKVLELIKKKVANKYLEQHKGNKSDSNIDIIFHGMDLVMGKVLANDSRRLTLDILKSVLKKKDTQTGIKFQPRSNNNAVTETGSKTYVLTTPTSCARTVEDTCEDLRTINEFVCGYDDTVMQIEKICDGTVDCPDGSDEQRCSERAVERVQKAARIISTIDLSKTCYPQIDGKASLLSKHGAMLSRVLQSQLDFINKYEIDRLLVTEDLYKRSVDGIAGEVAIVLRAFATTLSETLCGNAKDEFDLVLKKFGPEVLDEEFEAAVGRTVSPKSCECLKQFCKNHTCPTACKRICYQKFSLTQLSCKSISPGSTSVSLDMLCDGKFDCYDELDELNCRPDQSATMFEANSMFENVLKTLKTKILSVEFKPARQIMNSLYAEIKELHKRSAKRKLNERDYRSVRDKCFKLLSKIHIEILESLRNTDLKDDIYDFLLSINDKLINAMKRSHTGNLKMVSTTQCFCRDGLCAMALCSTKCNMTCAARPLLTMYNCYKSTNSSVGLETLCNEKANCPNGEDELNCKHDVCMSHHLVKLRQYIMNAGDKQTVLREVLGPWKTKVSTNLIFVEKHERPTPRVFRDIMDTILDDLVSTYSSLEEYKRANDNDGLLNKFFKLSQHMIESLKSCKI